MMMTPARRHLQIMSARAAAAAGGITPGAPAPIDAHTPGWPEYRLQLMQLGEDLRRLHQIQSIKRKIDAKREMIAKYAVWVDAALSAESAAQDEVVTTMLVWSIDIADWAYALRLAAHVIKHGLALPERYKRTAATLIAEEVATAGLTPTATVDLTTLQTVDDLTAHADMPDEVRAKIKKAIAQAFRARIDAFDPAADSAVAGGKAAMIATALAYFTRARDLDPKCGVKKMIEQLQRKAKKPGAETAG